MPYAKAKEVWDTALGELELQVSRPTFETWLRDTAGRALDGATLMVTVPSPFTAEWLEKRMFQLIRKTLQRVTGQSLEVRFQVHSPLPEEESSLSEPPWTLPLEEAPWGTPSRNGPLNERYSFETFVVGPSNRLAYSAAQAVADFPGLSYNPLFIYSGVGLGKTHLLHAIGHAVAKKGLSSLYVTTEQFTNEFVTAIRARTTEDFRAKYRNVEVLLIDDIQFIGGKEQTQEGFFHTFNDLHTARRQLVITSDRPPRALALLEDRLRSRFEWGLIADIQPPDLETRMAILRTKAEQLEMPLDDSVIEFIARKVQKNVRELEGSLNRVAAHARLSGGPVTKEMAAQALMDLMEEQTRRSLTPARVFQLVAAHFKVTPEALQGKRRDQRTALARQVAMYLLKEDLGLTFAEIGRLLGGRDHTTVMHGCARVTDTLNVDPSLRQDALALREALLQERVPVP